MRTDASRTAGESWSDHATTWAVVAHGLLNSMGAIKAAALTLSSRREELAEADALALLHRITQQAEVVAESLRAIVQGLPPEVVEQLDHVGSPPA
jgi:hypothetical protein